MIFANYNPKNCIKMCRSLFVRPETFFFSEIWKMAECHFLANVMLRESCLRASRRQKLQGLRVVCSKNFSRATFFCFLGQYIFALFACETNLKKKRSVNPYCHIHISIFSFIFLSFYSLLIVFLFLLERRHYDSFHNLTFMMQFDTIWMKLEKTLLTRFLQILG